MGICVCGPKFSGSEKGMVIKMDKRGNMSFITVIYQKDRIIERLKERGCRITSQRQLIIDTILKNECSCCKEIYYKAVKEDPLISIATVYRMIKTLEDIGAIDRRNMYKVFCSSEYTLESSCIINMRDKSQLVLSGADWAKVMEKGLKEAGYIQDQEIESIEMRGCPHSSNVF